MRHHPTPRDDLIYLTEGGFETELLYLRGLGPPCFAAFAILSNPAKRAVLRGIYERVCDVAAAGGTKGARSRGTDPSRDIDTARRPH